MSSPSSRVVHAVLPAGVDDPATPSGGNTYDRALCTGLAAAGWSVPELLVDGAWPGPDPAAQHHLAAALDAVPDGGIVLLDGLFAGAAPEPLAAAAGRLRLAVLVHLPLADETGLPADRAAALSGREGQLLRSADAVIATSDWAAQRLAARHGLPADRIAVAPPGVAPAPGSGSGSGSGSELLCVASVIPRKGQDLLLAGLRLVADLPWRCICVGGLGGDPGYVAQVRQAAQAARLADRFTLAGPRTGAELAATYAAADLLLLPSRAETYGMVVTEALAHGIPVLATDVGGVPEALGHTRDGTVPGRLVPPEDPAALGAALRWWLTDPAGRDRLRQAARLRRADLPGWPATVAAVDRVLTRLHTTAGAAAYPATGPTAEPASGPTAGPTAEPAIGSTVRRGVA